MSKTIVRSIVVNEKTYKEFKEICEEGGLMMGKIIERLIDNWCQDYNTKIRGEQK